MTVERAYVLRHNGTDGLDHYVVDNEPTTYDKPINKQPCKEMKLRANCFS